MNEELIVAVLIDRYTMQIHVEKTKSGSSSLTFENLSNGHFTTRNECLLLRAFTHSRDPTKTLPTRISMLAHKNGTVERKHCLITNKFAYSPFLALFVSGRLRSNTTA